MDMRVKIYTCIRSKKKRHHAVVRRGTCVYRKQFVYCIMRRTDGNGKSIWNKVS